MSDSEILEELSKPLKNKGKPSHSFLFTRFKRISNEQELCIKKEILSQWLQIFIDAFFTSTNNYALYQNTKKLYAEQLISRFDYVRFVGIALEGDIGELIELEKIFVLPNVGREAQTISSEILEKDMMWLEEDGDPQMDLISKPRQLIHQRSSAQGTFHVLDLLSNKHSTTSVLLGAPGSGKTLLMHYFSVMLAQGNAEGIGLDPNVDWLPISIDIRDLMKISNQSVISYMYKSSRENFRADSFPEGFFEYWLEDGRAVILLDGLDEIVNEVQRLKVVKRIYSFLNQFQDCRAVITSRVAAYRQDYFPVESYPQYYLQPFDDDNIKEFVRRWYDIRMPPSGASKLMTSLNDEINDSDRIKLLARNPLLLTIIALIHRTHTSLPRQRSKLYDRAVETLIGSWDAYKDIGKQNEESTNPKELQYLKPDDFRPLLEMTARWMHEQRGAGAIEEEVLFRQIGKDIRFIKGIKPHEAKKEAARFVFFISNRTGLLTRQGENHYAFVHKTFQEYLCAQSLLYQIHDELDLDVVLSLIKQDRHHDQHWQEVLLLLISQMKPKNAAITIGEILRKESEFGSLLHRNLVFSGRCLSENPRYLRQSNDECSQEVIEKLVDLEISDPRKIGYKVREQAAQTLCSLHETEFEKQAIDSLLSQKKRIGQVRLQQYKAVLGERESAIDNLLSLLEHKNHSVRAKSVLAVSTLDLEKKHLKATAKLILKRLDDDHHTVRASAIEAVGNFGISSKAIQRALKNGLLDDSFSVHTHTASALGKLGNSPNNSTSASIRKSLLLWLKDDDARIRAGAASAVGKLNNTSGGEVEALIKLLEDNDLGVRYGAIYSLGNLGHNSADVISTLEGLMDDKEPGIYASAALALGRLGESSEKSIEMLLTFLCVEVHWLHAHPEWKIGNLAYVVKTLLEGAEDDFLLKSKREGIVRVIDNLFDNEDEWWAVSQIVWALGSSPAELIKSVGFSAQMPQKIFKRLEDDDPRVRYNASYALRKLSQKNPDYATQIVQWIRDNHDADFVGYGIDVLWDCAQEGVLSLSMA